MKKTLLLALLGLGLCATPAARATSHPGHNGHPGGNDEEQASALEHEIITSAALLGVDYSPDGKRVVTCGLGRDIVVWNVDSGKPVLTLKGHTDDVVAVKFSPNGRYIASGGVDKALILWDALTGEILRKNTDHLDYVRDVAFSPNSKMLASAGWDGQALVFDTFSGQRLATLGTAMKPAGPTAIGAAYDKAKTTKGRTTNMTSVAFSPDGSELLTANGDHSLRGFDTKTWQQKYVLNGHTDEVWDARYSPNGAYAVSGAWDNTARVWNLATQQQVYNIPAHVSDVWASAFSPDGQLIATGGGDRKVKIWDMATGHLVADLSGTLHTAEVENLAFSPDGQHLASVSRDGSLKLWAVPGTEERVAAYTAENMVKWGRKSEFEKTDEYQKRLAKQGEREAAFRQEGREKMTAAFGTTANWKSFTLGDYNADTEYFTLVSPLFAAPYRVKVSPKDAERFRDNFARVGYGNPQFEFLDGTIVLKQVALTEAVGADSKSFTLSR